MKLINNTKLFNEVVPYKHFQDTPTQVIPKLTVALK